MNFKKYHVSRNLFPLDENKLHVGRIENDGTIDYEIGTLTVGTDSVTYEANTTWRGFYTDFIQVNENEQLTFSPNVSSSVSWACACYDENDSFLGKATAQATASIKTFTLLTGTKKVRMSVTSSNATYTILRPMFNTGSQPLPYEPYSSEVWHDTPHYIHNTSTDTLTTLPAVLYPNDTTATVGLKGQTVKSGTPTPDSPVMPQGTGERTGNLLPEFYATSGEISGNSYTITKNSIETHNDGSILGAWYVLAEFKRYGNYANYTSIDEKHSFKIPAGTYTFSGNENIYSANNGLRLIVGELGQTVAGATGGAKNIGVGQTFTINEDSYVCPVLEIRSDSRVDEYTLTNPMLNTGSTALPYEPFGVKIPILSADTTTNNYLGEVETTRKIKKWVLTGEEDWSKSGAASNTFYTVVSGYLRQRGVIIDICSHYTSQANINGAAEMQDGNVSFYANAGQQFEYFYVRDSNLATVANLKSYLQQQYAAGTPVTVWYVLAEPETGIVNEPLMRIGDYADTLSNISIPVTAGGDTLSIDTTVQPSEVTVNYKGWHPVADVHEKSKNLFDKSVTPYSTTGFITREGALTEYAGWSVSNYVELSSNSEYTLSGMNTNAIYSAICFYTNDKTYISGLRYDRATELTFTTPANCKYALISYVTSKIDTVMLNTGSTALPYEPYWT